eukprot:evm.model.scf_1750.1 EVM.evm.TU.scf_1750.1   scf_1750:1711-12758(-)
MAGTSRAHRTPSGSVDVQDLTIGGASPGEPTRRMPASFLAADAPKKQPRPWHPLLSSRFRKRKREEAVQDSCMAQAGLTSPNLCTLKDSGLANKSARVRGERVLPLSLAPQSSSVGSGPDPKATEGEVDRREAIRAVLETLHGCADEEQDVPERTLQVTLLPHQRVALAWMARREEASQVRGGMLCDEQGLGKTVSAISLIATHGPPLSQMAQRMGDTCQGMHGESGQANDANTEALLEAGTLIVCPLVVLKQWASELKDKVHHAAGLSTHLYYGKDKAKTAKELAQYSVVLTTYGSMVSEAPTIQKRNGASGVKISPGSAAYPIDLLDLSDLEEDPECEANGKRRKKRKAAANLLYQVKWLRVVLDEAQVIKSPRTRVAHAAWSLNADRRWCLTGTPIQNSVDDFYSYFKFLRYKPYDGVAAFKDLIGKAVQCDPTLGYKRLQAILQGILLRRTKASKIGGRPIVTLPERRQRMLKHRLSPSERKFYDELKAQCAAELRRLGVEGGRTTPLGYTNMLMMLLRLRQAASHPWLVTGRAMEDDDGKPTSAQLAAARRLGEADRQALLSLVSSAPDPCPLCRDLPECPRVGPCGHVFCQQCILSHLPASTEACGTCPACGANMTPSDAFSRRALRLDEPADDDGRRRRTTDGSRRRRQTTDDDDGDGSWHPSGRNGAEGWTSSSKIDRLMELLESITGSGKAEGGPRGSTPRSTSDRELSSVFRKLPDPVSHAGSCPDKVLVFSQWTGMLDLIQEPLRSRRIKFRRLDGRMGLGAREAAVADFMGRPDVLVMLVSLRASGVGLNLTAANHVVFMDLWWNPTVEEQAIDRVHRIGQARHVQVTRLMVQVRSTPGGLCQPPGPSAAGVVVRMKQQAAYIMRGVNWRVRMCC